MDLKLKLDRLRVFIVCHANFYHVEYDKVLTRASWNDLHAANYIFTM